MKKLIASLAVFFALIASQDADAQGRGNPPPGPVGNTKSPNRSNNHTPPGHGGTPPGLGGNKPPGHGGPNPGNGNGPENKSNGKGVAVTSASVPVLTINNPSPALPPGSTTANWPSAPAKPVIAGKKN